MKPLLLFFSAWLGQGQELRLIGAVAVRKALVLLLELGRLGVEPVSNDDFGDKSRTHP